MDYQKIHDQIISRAQNRDKPDCYCEKHHILPKSMGGTNNNDNLVWLTAREHFIIHWLLYKIYRNKQMSYAFFSMTKIGNNCQKRYTSRSFEYARKAIAWYLSNFNSGENNPCYGLYGEDNPNFGSKRTEETKRKLSEKALERYKTEKNPKARKIINITTNEIFESISEAKEMHGGNVSHALKYGCATKGYEYRYINKDGTIAQPESNLPGYASGDNHGFSRKVKNTETGQIFFSISDAAKSIDVTPTAIGIAIKQKRKCKGVAFRYV